MNNFWEDVLIFGVIGILIALMFTTCAIAISPLVNKIAVEIVDYFF